MQAHRDKEQRQPVPANDHRARNHPRPGQTAGGALRFGRRRHWALGLPGRGPRTAESLGKRELWRLFREYRRTNDVRLRNRLVELHGRLAREVARSFTPGPGDSADDLRQVAYLGLIGAVERFDPAAGYQFTTFARATIRGVIMRHFRDYGRLIKTPRSLRDLAWRVAGIRASLQQELGRPATLAELADAAGVAEEQLVAAMEAVHLHHLESLESRADEGGASLNLPDRLGAEDPRLAAFERRQWLQQAIDLLDERHRTVIRMRFFEEATQTEVAAGLGVSQMQVSRWERQALEELRQRLQAAEGMLHPAPPGEGKSRTPPDEPRK